MITNNQRQLMQKIEKQMGIENREVLNHWKHHSYRMDKDAALAFWNMVKEAEAIYIVGDYDCDGVLASYNMSKAIRHNYKTKPIHVRIPKRLSEGYGINHTIYEEIKEKMPKGLIITVDNGIACADLVEEMRADGYQVIITDHHELGKRRMPPANMVLNPKAPVDKQLFDGDYWCGAAVVYKIVEDFVSEPLKKELEVFAGIATVGDIMPLKEGNWGLVKRTMEAIKREEAPKSVLDLLRALKQEPENVIETSLSFYLIPAINAAGRLLDDGAKLPLSYFLKPTPEKCEHLVELNNERKVMRDAQTERVRELIHELGLANNCPIWVAENGLHEGIVGLIAGQIAEEFQVPAIVLTESHKNHDILKGSARSVGDINIFEYLSSLGDIFAGFGGHKGAAGLSIPKDNFKIASDVQIPKPDISCEGSIKMTIAPNEISDMAETIEYYRPFGEANPMPEFSVDVNLKNSQSRMLGTPPVHLCINDPLKKYKMMHFFHEPNALKNPDTFRLAGEIHYETYKGKTTSVLVADEVTDYEEEEKESERDGYDNYTGC